MVWFACVGCCSTYFLRIALVCAGMVVWVSLVTVWFDYGLFMFDCLRLWVLWYCLGFVGCVWFSLLFGERCFNLVLYRFFEAWHCLCCDVMLSGDCWGCLCR